MPYSSLLTLLNDNDDADDDDEINRNKKSYSL